MQVSTIFDNDTKSWVHQVYDLIWHVMCGRHLFDTYFLNKFYDIWPYLSWYRSYSRSVNMATKLTPVSEYQ